jgi:toxin ParE1/3/4
MIGHFILSKAAQEDLQEIYDYSIHVFGINQAITYLEGFQFCFQDLAQNPKMGKKRDGIKEGLYSTTYNSHIVFYRICSKNVRIVRVLHGRRDLQRLI